MASLTYMCVHVCTSIEHTKWPHCCHLSPSNVNENENENENENNSSSSVLDRYVLFLGTHSTERGEGEIPYIYHILHTIYSHINMHYICLISYAINFRLKLIETAQSFYNFSARQQLEQIPYPPLPIHAHALLAFNWYFINTTSAVFE